MSIKKGGKAKNHKYYMRVDSGNSKYPYIYFYSKDEYQTWLNGKAGSQGKKKTLKTKEEILDRLRDIVNQTFTTVKNTATNTVNTIQKYVDKNGNGKLDVIDSIENRRRLKQIEKAAEKADQKQKDTSKRKKNERTAFENKRQAKVQGKKEPEDFGHTEEPEDHKYIAKLFINGYYRYFYTQDELRAFYQNNEGYQDLGMENFDMISEPMDEYESQSEINKNYKVKSLLGVDLEPGWSMNCYSCTLAYEARRRGYDVEAIYDTDGGSLDEICSAYSGVSSPIVNNEYFDPNSGWDFAPAYNKTYDWTGTGTLKSANDMLLDKYQDGARGNLLVYWQNGSAHSMAWEISDGDVLIRDCQNNTVQKMADYRYARYIAANGVLCLRTDDKEFSEFAGDYLAPADDDDEAKEYKKKGVLK